MNFTKQQKNSLFKLITLTIRQAGRYSLTFVSCHVLWVGLYDFVVNKDPWVCSLHYPDHFQILLAYSINTNTLL